MTTETKLYDVLIVGAGNAACGAAMAALEKNVRVGVLEKASKKDRVGNSALTGHIRFVFYGIEDLRPLVKNATEAEMQSLIDRLPRRTEEDAWDEVMRVTDHQSDEESPQVHVTELRNTVHWLAANGQDWVSLIGAQALGDYLDDKRRRLRASETLLSCVGSARAQDSLRHFGAGVNTGRAGPCDRRGGVDAARHPEVFRECGDPRLRQL